MIRLLRVSVTLLALTGYALPQVAPPAGGANAPGPAQGPGRGGFARIVIGPPAPVPPEVAIPRPTPDELAQVNDALTKWIASNKSPPTAAEEVPIAADASTAASECRGHLHADPAAHGSAPRRLRRDREARATSTCCCTATRSPIGGCKATPTRRCSTSTSAASRRPISPSPATPRKESSGG